jgi:hypothetical protein
MFLFLKKPSYWEPQFFQGINYDNNVFFLIHQGENLMEGINICQYHKKIV